MSGMSGDDSGAFSESLRKAMDLIARCRYVEMMGVRPGHDTTHQKAKEARNTLIHTIFENSKDRRGKPQRKSLPEMIDEHRVDIFHPGIDIKQVYDALKLESENQKLVMLFIAVVNACREQMYSHSKEFFEEVKPEIFRSNVLVLLDENKLKVEVITERLEKDDMFKYLPTAKKLSQLRNSLTQDIPGLKKKINSAMDENLEYDKVLKGVQEEVLGRIGSGFSNLAQFFHTMWTCFWKIRDGESMKRSLGDITAQTIRLLGIVPQVLEFPGIVVKLSNDKKLRWFDDTPGSLPEFFGVQSDSCLLEELIVKLKTKVRVIVGTGGSVSELHGYGGGGKSDESASELPPALEFEALCRDPIIIDQSKILKVIYSEEMDSQKTQKLTEILASVDVRIVQCFPDSAHWNQSTGRFEGAPNWNQLANAVLSFYSYKSQECIKLTDELARVKFQLDAAKKEIQKKIAKKNKK